MAATVCVKTGYEYLALFFGAHTLSISVIQAAFLFCIAMGSYFGGKLATKKEKGLLFFLCFSFVAGAFALLFSQIFPLKTLVPVHAVLFIPGLVLSLGIIAAVFPLLAAYYIKNATYAGRFVSTWIMAGSSGLITGLFLTSFVLVRNYGLHKSLLGGGLAILFMGLATLLLYINQHGLASAHTHLPLADRVRKTKLRFKKKKTVIEINPKLTRAMLRVFLFQAFFLASFLIISLRDPAGPALLKPEFHHTIIYIVFFTGLLAGAALYKRVADPPANSYLTFATFQIMTGFGTALVLIWIILFSQRDHQVAMAPATFSEQIRFEVLRYMATVFLPALLTGISMPLTAKVLCRRLQTTGMYFGRLGILLAFGALAGNLFTRYVLLPTLGAVTSTMLLAFLVLLSGIYIVLRDSRLRRGFRLGYGILTLMLFALVFGLFNLYNSKNQEPDNNEITLLQTIEGSTGTVRLYNRNNSDSLVTLDGKPVFNTGIEGLRPQVMSACAPVILNDRIGSALVIGFGSGITATILEKNGVPEMTIAENFPEMVRLSSDVFANLNDDIMTNNHINITIKDPRAFLNLSGLKFDLITMPIDQTLSCPALYSTGFYSLCRDKLNADGMLCQVLPLSRLRSSELASIIKSCKLVFKHVNVWTISAEQILMVASKVEMTIDWCRFSNDYESKAIGQELKSAGFTDKESVLAGIFLSNRQVNDFTVTAPENTDDRNVIKYSREVDHANDAFFKKLASADPDLSGILRFPSSCLADSIAILENIRLKNRTLRGSFQIH
jgi:predicted membrane-bound spermidine synthase